MSGTFQYLSEKPERRNLLFGHRKILDTLIDIVSNCPSPFTIGLFGRWGSGKSSIAESLQDALKVKEIPVVLFDVWKHEGDALRRTFLKETYRQLRGYGDNFFDMDFSLDARIEGDIQRKLIDHFNWRSIFQIGLKYIILPLFVCLLFYLRLKEVWPAAAEIVEAWKGELATLTVIIAILQFVYTYFKDLAIASDVLITQNRLTDPHDFEEEFNRILNATRYGRIAIVFDNLDRVSGDTALKIISTIKTFLEPVDRANKKKKVIFILPCDVNAIKRHISSAVNLPASFNFTGSGPVSSNRNNISESHDYSDEFLRKFFNTIIWIPEFYEVELEKYANEKLQETKIKEFNNPELAWLVIQVFSQNPRQIIQFINVLISNYLVIKKISETNGFGDKLFYQNNVAQLAKFVLLVQRFPNVMEVYRLSKTYDIMSPPPVNVNDLPEWHEFNRFRENTASIIIASLEPFFTFKISDYERQLPGVTRLFDAMDSNDLPLALSESGNLKIDENLEDFCGAVKNYLKHKSNSVVITNFLNVLFAITEDKSIKLTGTTYLSVQKILLGALTHVDRIKPSLLVNEFIKKDTGRAVPEHIKQRIVVRWVDVFRGQHGEMKSNPLTEEFEIDMIRQLQVMHFYLTPDLQTLLQGVSSTKTGNLALAEVLVDCDVQHKFLGPAFAESLLLDAASAFPNQDKIFRSIKIVTKIEKAILKPMTIQFILERTGQIMNYVNVVHRIEEKVYVVEHVLLLLNCFSQQLSDDADSTAAAGFVNLLDSTHNNLSTSKYIFLPIASRLATFNNQLYPRIVDKVYREFAANLNSSDPSIIAEAFQNIFDVNGFVSQYKDTIRQSVRNSPDQFIAVYKVSPEYFRLEMLVQWINELRFEWLVVYQDQLMISTLTGCKSIFDAIVNRLRENNDPNIWRLALQFVNQLKNSQEGVERAGQTDSDDFLKPDADALNNLREVLIAKLKLEDPTMSEMALNWIYHLRLLTDSDKGAIAANLATWLTTIGRSFRPHIYEAIFEGFGELEQKHKISYVNHIFDVLVLQSSNTDQISYAVKYLNKLSIDVSDFLPKIELMFSNALALRGNNPALVKSLIGALLILTENSLDQRVKELHAIASEAMKKI